MPVYFNPDARVTVFSAALAPTISPLDDDATDLDCEDTVHEQPFLLWTHRVKFSGSGLHLGYTAALWSVIRRADLTNV